MAGLEQAVPDSLGKFGRKIELEAVLSRVSGARYDAMHAVHFTRSEVIILERGDRRLRQAFENPQRFWSLNRYLRVACAGIFELGLVAKIVLIADVVEILVLIAGVYAKQVM